jgi:hypothetical protein
LERLEDAFQLLERAADSYVLTADQGKEFAAVVRIGRGKGTVSGESRARVITMAVAHALGLASAGEVVR